MGGAGIDDRLEDAQHRHRQLVEPRVDPRIAAIGGEQELGEVVGADREEIDPLQQRVELVEQRRHLDHGADLDALGELVAVAAQIGQFALDQLLALVELLDRRHHGEHQLELAVRRRPQQRPNLAAQQRRAVEAEPDRAPAERGVLLLDVAHVGQHLVAADVEGAEGHRPAGGRIEHGAVERELLAGARELRGHHELQLGAEQADARGAGFDDVRQVDQEAGIDQELHLLAVAGDTGLVAQRKVLELAARPQPHELDIGGFEVGGGADMDLAARPVDDDGIGGIDEPDRIADLADRGDAERARDDGDVGGRAAFLEDEAAQPLAVVVEQRRRTHRPRDQDRVLRQVLARRRVVAAEQLAQQAVGEIVEVVQALAQVGIGLAQHAGAGVGLDALDRGFRGQAGRHRLLELVHPAAVVGEHAVGFEHVAMLAAFGHVAVLEHGVEVGAQRRDRRLQALAFLVGIVGDEIGDDDPRLVQHHVAERDAVVERGSVEVQGAARGGLGARRRDGGELARRDHLRHHHGGGLERLDLLLGVGAPRPVLHHQHAERVAGAQDRHPEEGAVDLLAGFRAVGEGGVRLRLGQVDGVRLAGDEADEAFVGRAARCGAPPAG